MQSLWMLVACAMFALMGAFVKFAADYEANMPQIILFRGLPSVLLIFFWARYHKKSLRPLSWKAHLLRNGFGVSSMWLGFTALSMLPLSTAISLNYTAPLFIGVWMLFFGGTQRDPIRIIAVLLGFFGVLAVLRPSINAHDLPYALLGLLAGSCAAVAMMQIRQLGRLGEPEWRTVFIFSCFVCCTGLLALGYLGWPHIHWQAYAALAGVGISGLFGQLAMTRAFGLGSTLLTAVLQYSTIIFAAGLGIAIWSDVPDTIAWGGMLLIIASGLISAWRTYTEDRIMQGQVSSR
ncbi:MAG TPA: DMT family transporter [Paenalcaligenes hominis]|uniref:DMT family transporter n=1 Tax=Paenalcaligenes hominis TaxID=643674 RepID=A0A9D2VFW2_9BURK|nr:DMT family transporter [Paenalcaligenes hominis]NJB66128.1 S-adenosylmethionine uptake transporter [Paenalcaligenes hominis]GGE73731.1 membrane protein [Paenalcaligenes hominis]HJH24218.1 DMT family transporter [Paenalcaligenes hominis]